MSGSSTDAAAVATGKIGNVTFDGAAGFTWDDETRNPGKKEFTCDKCKGAFPFYSHLAYVYAQSMAFVKIDDEAAVRAVCGVTDLFGKWHNHAKEQVMLVCYLCCEEIHKPKESYVRTAAGPANAVKLTSQWLNKAKASKGMIPQSKVTGQMKVIEHALRKRKDLEEDVSLVDLQKAKLSEHFSKAGDWVTTLCDFIFFLYGCGKCKTWPCKNGDWFRMARAKGMGGTEKGGIWRCANCGEKWTWTTMGSWRLFVVGDVQQEKSVFMARCGWDASKTWEHLDNQIHILKLGCLYKEITVLGQSVELTTDIILKALSSLADKSQLKIAALVETEILVAKDPKETANASVPLYCEDRALSIDAPGRNYRSIQLEAEPMQLTTHEVQELIDFSAYFINLQGINVTEPAQKRTLNEMNKRARSDSNRISNLIESSLADLVGASKL